MTRHPPEFPEPPVLLGDWLLWEAPTLNSTNDAASTLSAWNAVRADAQRSGRGRHNRTWVSGPGGLWLSAVIPTGPVKDGWAALPLAAALAVCEVLHDMGVSPLRLRWPNDVMTGSRKLAGILVDQFQAGLAVVGIGINVTNRPETSDPRLVGEVARVEDFVERVPDLRAFSSEILQTLRGICLEMQDRGFGRVVDRVNTWWADMTPITLETETESFEGTLRGVDSAGRLRIASNDGQERLFSAHQVVRLRESGKDR